MIRIVRQMKQGLIQRRSMKIESRACVVAPSTITQREMRDSEEYSRVAGQTSGGGGRETGNRRRSLRTVDFILARQPEKTLSRC